MIKLDSNIALAGYTTMGIGGPAANFGCVTSEAELADALDYCRQRACKPFILGGGSNLFIADAGYTASPVIQVCIEGLEQTTAPDGRTRLIAGAGMKWDDLVQYAVAENLQGIECLSGIPGTVGASPIQNIGAYGQEVKDTIAWVEGLNVSDGQKVRFSNADCQFQYRWSRFKAADGEPCVVTRVAFDLVPGGAPAVRYGDLTRYLQERGIDAPTLADVRAAVLEIRRGKGMVVDPAIPDSRSCGSFFMNPIVPVDQADRVAEIASREGLLREGETMPRYPAGDGHVKLSAAWLMERAGLRRGHTHGNVGLSSLHILAIVNRGGGTSAEVLELIRHVRKTVHQRFGIILWPEPVFMGFDTATLDDLKDAAV